MSGKKKVRIAALGLVAVSLGNILVLTFVAPASADWGTRAVRFTLTCILVAFLFRGASWARWVTGALCAMGVLAGVVSLIALPAMGAGWGLLSEWMLVMTFALGWIAWTLLVDGDVSRYFSGADG
jgi:hypothetical protein